MKMRSKESYTIPHRETLERIADVLGKSEHILILGHEKPDGDAIGSGLALALALSALGKRALMLLPDPRPATYDFLPGTDLLATVESVAPHDVAPDVAVFLDCTGPDRAGKALGYARSEVWINIDHHISNSGFGHISLVDPEASATGELVFFLLKVMGAEIDTDVATCLYVAIVTDTGGFRYENTGPRCFFIAAELVDRGVSPSLVADLIYETRSLSSLMLLKSALQTLTLCKGGKIATIDVTRAMLQDAGASLEDADSIVNYPRSIAGVEVALCFKESLDGTGVHVSFRSKSNVDVAKIAALLGGGGHARAAGALIPGTLEQVKARVFEVLDGLELWKDS